MRMDEENTADLEESGTARVCLLIDRIYLSMRFRFLDLDLDLSGDQEYC